MGESKLVIDWARQKATVSDVRLEPLLCDIKISLQSFEWLSFSHIFRELNAKKASYVSSYGSSGVYVVVLFKDGLINACGYSFQQDCLPPTHLHELNFYD
jgi:hypothetical protein